MVTAARLTVQSTENWAWTREYNIQMAPSTLKEHFPNISHGEFLMIETKHREISFTIFGKVDIKDTDNHLDPGEVGIGLNLRYALGAPIGETVCVVNRSPPGYRSQRLDEILGRRPVLCRVRKGVHPDIGFNICRISETTMDSLGITPGDRIIIESIHESITLKVLPIRDEIADRKRKQMKQNSDRYPDPIEVLSLDDIADTKIDIPEIYIDSERRKELQLGSQAKAEGSSPLDSGACQPVKVTRNATSVYLRSLNEVTVPVIVGLLATLFVFDPWLSTEAGAVIIIVGVVFILLSILYRVRRTSLN